MSISQHKHREWWRGAVMYQIYPRSFMDSNGDGVGDLNGITQHLDYVADLGVDGVWISPICKSPMRDFGYDVSDYCDIDPIFGTLADFDRLLNRAHELGLKVIIDQVYSHTSSEHAWFTESRSAADNPKADWYVWVDAREDGTPPNNWLSVFGGPAWTWDGRRLKYYLHNFLPEQPDLNLHNPEVQDALLDVARFWLERGVDGFRMDAINLGMHDPELRDNPAMPRPAGETPPKPYFMQNPIYNLSHDDMPKFLERLRSLTDEYGEKFTVAEVGGLEPLAVQMAYTAQDRRLSAAYAWDLLVPDRPSAAQFRKTFEAWPGDPREGWPSWAFCNHDAPRTASRWAEPGVDADWPRLFALLLMSLRGNVFIYQGEELGLPQAEVPFERLQDPEAIANWPHTLGRDGARTPMPWEPYSPNFGFSAGEPWLPVDAHHGPLSIRPQQEDPDSVLNFFKRLVRLRRSSSALKHGEIGFLSAPKDVLAFTRRSEEELYHCVFNLAEKPVAWAPEGAQEIEVKMGAGIDWSQGAVPQELPGFSGYIARSGK